MPSDSSADFEIGQDAGTERSICLGARNDRGELGARPRQLLGRPNPPLRAGGGSSRSSWAIRSSS